MDRWHQIEFLFQEALQRDPAERDAYLREACQGDSDLRREVASLLANHQTATDSKRGAAAAAAKLIDGPVSLELGQCPGPYRIECFLPAGGMGEVYRAIDTRLHREVAIKVSAARFSERFDSNPLLMQSSAIVVARLLPSGEKLSRTPPQKRSVMIHSTGTSMSCWNAKLFQSSFPNCRLPFVVADGVDKAHLPRPSSERPVFLPQELTGASLRRNRVQDAACATLYCGIRSDLN